MRRKAELPARHPRRAVVYTGTHDNDTLCGWYAGLDDGTRAFVQRATGLDAGELPLGLIRVALESPAGLAIVPLQDLLGLGREARMNTPGSTKSNWTWRQTEPLRPELAARLLELTRRSGRTEA